MRRILAVFVLVLAWNGPALAENKTGKVDASVARLGALSAAERELLKPHLAHGPVILTEFQNRQTDLPAVIYAARIHAPAQTVAAVIGKPSEYPRFMTALTSVDVREVTGSMTGFDWTWGVSLFTMSGRNVMTTYPGNAERGYRFDIRTIGGELGIGRVMWRVYPDGRGKSLVVFSSRLDMRDANYITRQLAAEGNAVNRTINVAVAMVTLLEIKAESERRAGTYVEGVYHTKPLRRPEVDMKALWQLLGRGDLVLMDDPHNPVIRIHDFPNMDEYIENRTAGWIEKGLEFNSCFYNTVEVTKSQGKGGPYTEIVVHKNVVNG